MRVRMLGLWMMATMVCCGAWAVDNPNIVVVITDDQGYGDLGAHGNDIIRTPNLDALHASSTRIDPFYVSPVCAPTRASLMTGRYNYRTGVVDTYIGRAMMHTSEVTLAEVLRSGGYRTGLFGKWHLGDNYPLRPQDQGFDEVLMHRGGGIGQPSDPFDNRYTNPRLQHNGEEKVYEGYCTDIFFNEAMAWMETQDRPFFTYIATNAPHTPLEVPESYAARYRDKGLTPELEKLYGMVENIDDNMGRLQAFLQDKGLAESTLLVFLTDNGPQFSRGLQRYSADMRGAKGSVYENGIRVPCFFHWPDKLPAGRVIDTPAAHIDLLPTLAAFAAVELPTDLYTDGRNLAPLLRGETTDRPQRPLFFQWHRGDAPEPFRDAAVRLGDFKLVNGEELYNLAEDPAEKNNVAADNPDTVTALREDYEAWFADVSATRGYAPPRIVLNPDHEPRTVLTPQDWRDSEGWPRSRYAHWELNVATPGDYTVTLDFVTPTDATKVLLEFGPLRQEITIDPESTQVISAPFHLQPGPTRLRFRTDGKNKHSGPRHVYVQKQ